MDITIWDTSNRPIQVNGNDLLIAVDETGHERFTDSKYPVFGLAACMCLGSEYENFIHKPWERVKLGAGLKSSDALHAASIDLSNKKLITGLTTFFQSSKFGRIAIGCSNATIFMIDINPIDLCVKVLFENVRKAFDVYNPNNIVIVIEESSRLNKIYRKSFMDNRLYVSKKGVLTNIGLMRKSEGFFPLEIVDFIAQAYGNEIIRQLYKKPMVRKDVKSIFTNKEAKYSYNKYITEVTRI